MPDVHVRIEASTTTKDRGTQGARIDRARRPHLDVVFDDHTAKLRDAHEAAVVVCPAEPRSPDHGVRTDEYASSDRDSRLDDGMRTDDRMRADHDVITNHGECSDDRGGMDLGARCNQRPRAFVDSGVSDIIDRPREQPSHDERSVGMNPSTPRRHT